MNELTNIEENQENIDIENMIYEIRGKQVMVDRDLAKIYNVETKVLNQAVKRNIKRFPINYCFQMNKEEFENWKSQIVLNPKSRTNLILVI